MKKYYWIKLKNNFFSQREIKKLRSIAGGDTYVIIYLRLQLHSLENVGKILYAETEESIYEQLSYELDEDQQNIQVTMKFLVNHRLIEMVNDQDISMVETKELIGSECDSASRVRRYRNKNKKLQCNSDVTISNKLVTTEQEQYKETDKEIENKQTNTSFSNVVDYEYVKEYLIHIGLSSSSAENIINENKDSLHVVLDACLATGDAIAKQSIKKTKSDYFFGVLKNLQEAK